MPISDANNKTDRLFLLRKMFEQPGTKLRTGEIARRLGVSEDSAKRYIDALSADGSLPLRKDGQCWMLAEDAHIERLQVRLDYPEATALYIAGRLLASIHDERNMPVITSLTKLTEAMPKLLRPHLFALVEMAERRQQNSTDRSPVFEALAIGWLKQRKVRLHYAPLHHNKKPFDCTFSPYLLEPSGIGRTIYAIGYSDPPGELRTYKLERIEFVEVKDEAFTIPPDFNGPELLSRAWGIMYGDEEPVTVCLRFSYLATKRLKETLWHPSQKIVDTPEGCEWTATIGDIVEIENWIRGWGADCEVMEPTELRERVIDHVRRQARMYGVLSPVSPSTDKPDAARLSRLLGGQGGQKQ
jgi:predicted DNA-binding transcriptional regulator YafY